MTRNEVEKYFRERDVNFSQMGWIEERTAFADLVRVGEETPPWYCEDNSVDIAFEFAATESHKPWMAFDTDVLKKVHIVHQFGACL